MLNSERLLRATHLDVEAEVRYWEDATVNGVQDSDGSLIPGRVGDLWKVRVDLARGCIEGWPDGVTARLHYKVCDQGEYWLAGQDGQRVAKWRSHYVPSRFLCHGGTGHGDYIIMSVTEGGQIHGYLRPGINDEQWEAIAPAPGVPASA